MKVQRSHLKNEVRRGAEGWVRYRVLLFLVVLTCCCGPRCLAQPTEHQLKAAVLGNVAKFVEWPEDKSDESVVIGILGHDPFGSDLEVVLKSVRVKGKGFVVKRSGDIGELLNCQMIFLSASETGRAAELIRKVGARPILTVGEESRFLDAGGGISLETELRKIQISINLPAVNDAGLTVNPQLLSLAKTVRRKEKR